MPSRPSNRPHRRATTQATRSVWTLCGALFYCCGMITDVHTHAFPDALAERAMNALLAETENVRAYHDGKISSLLASMDQAGIDRALVCSIATKPEQFEKILNWSKSIASDRIIPLPSVHPQAPNRIAQLEQIAAEGYCGIKLHPYYQDFYINDPAMDSLYDALSELGLALVCHTGFDIAFPRIRRCDPEKIVDVVARFPKLALVTTHFGSWSDWDEVRKHLLGRPIYMEPSYSLDEMSLDAARDMALRHPVEYLLFGTDSPWQDQSRTLSRLRAMELGPEREQAILNNNAVRLFGLPAGPNTSVETKA